MLLSPVFWFSESFKVSHILWEALVPDLLRSASYQRSLPKQENWQSGKHEIIWNPPRHPRNLCGNNQITIRFLDLWCFLAAFSEVLHWIGCQLVGLLRLLKASKDDIAITPLKLTFSPPENWWLEGPGCFLLGRLGIFSGAMCSVSFGGGARPPRCFRLDSMDQKNHSETARNLRSFKGVTDFAGFSDLIQWMYCI